jgi:hypothetical protein
MSPEDEARLKKVGNKSEEIKWKELAEELMAQNIHPGFRV